MDVLSVDDFLKGEGQQCQASLTITRSIFDFSTSQPEGGLRNPPDES